MKMKFLSYFFFMAIIAAVFSISSCSKDDTTTTVTYNATLVALSGQTGSGTAVAKLTGNSLAVTVTYTGIAPVTLAHIHNGANGGVPELDFGISLTSPFQKTFTLTTAQIQNLNDGQLYVAIHTTNAAVAVLGYLKK